MKSVVIIGGGIIGLCSANYLNKQGYDVTVIDSGDLTDGTSFGNAGYVSPSHFIPLASPAVVGKALRWMLNASSPFYVKPRLDPDLLRWGMAFWKSSRLSYMMKNIPHLNNILCFSRDLTIAMKNELGNHFRMEEKGCLMLYRERATEKQEQALAQVSGWQLIY
jgi:D-amino-acid dehydrogenase